VVANGYSRIYLGVHDPSDRMTRLPRGVAPANKEREEKSKDIGWSVI
jgi:hypothetical protein